MLKSSVVLCFIAEYRASVTTDVCRKRLQEQCKLVLEENELLLEQLDVQQQKHDEQQKMHVQEGLMFTIVLVNYFFILCCTVHFFLADHTATQYDLLLA